MHDPVFAAVLGAVAAESSALKRRTDCVRAVAARRDAALVAVRRAEGDTWAARLVATEQRERAKAAHVAQLRATEAEDRAARLADKQARARTALARRERAAAAAAEQFEAKRAAQHAAAHRADDAASNRPNSQSRSAQTAAAHHKAATTERFLLQRDALRRHAAGFAGTCDRWRHLRATQPVRSFGHAVAASPAPRGAHHGVDINVLFHAARSVARPQTAPPDREGDDFTPTETSPPRAVNRDDDDEGAVSRRAALHHVKRLPPHAQRLADADVSQRRRDAAIAEAAADRADDAASKHGERASHVERVRARFEAQRAAAHARAVKRVHSKAAPSEGS